MYFNIGGGTLIDDDEIIGIFDLDITSQSIRTRKFLSLSEKRGEVINTAEDLPKSFAVCSGGGKNRIYLSQMNTATLAKRSESGFMSAAETGKE